MASVTSLHIAPRTGNFEPYRSYDWVVRINDVGGDQLELALETAFFPTVSFDEIELGYGNDYVYVPGKARVEQGTLVYRDFVSPHTAELLQDWWLQHYNPRTGIQQPATNYKKSGLVLKFGPGESPSTGQRVRGWDLDGIFMFSANFGPNIDMNASDVKKIEVVLRFDRAYPRV